jgi:hypothetical protein
MGERRPRQPKRDIPGSSAGTLPDLDRFADAHKGWLFRGQRSPQWDLETSLERASRRCDVEQREYERVIVREFRRHVHSYLTYVPKEDDTLEWLALMQHYGAPTRLLDFTSSFWIALFFAFEEAEEECCVIALDPGSLAPTGRRDFNAILRGNIEDGRNCTDYLYSDVPFFTNERLAIQKGTFVFSLNLKKTFHDLLIEKEKIVEQIKIPRELFAELRSKLNEFNCNSRVLFPGIDGYARYFKNHTWA